MNIIFQKYTGICLRTYVSNFVCSGNYTGNLAMYEYFEGLRLKPCQEITIFDTIYYG